MIGETLDGKYRILTLLGRGGMGTVYEAQIVGTPRRVAVKVIDERVLDSGRDAVSRFRREARAAGAIESDHIIRILDASTEESGGPLYIVMERLVGEDLGRLLDRLGPLPPEVVLRIGAQALEGLSRAHAAGIVHRDVKPANLFLHQASGGRIIVKVLDFGIAKIMARLEDVPHTTNLTRSDGFVGSPRFMSPEQARSSKSIDQRSDIWSLGASLYRALTGRAPHHDVESMGELIVTLCTVPPPPLEAVARWVPEEVARAVEQAMVIDPDGRYPTAEAMLRSLRPLLPSGSALSEEMLVALPAEVRVIAAAPLAPSTRAWIQEATLHQLRGAPALALFPERATADAPPVSAALPRAPAALPPGPAAPPPTHAIPLPVRVASPPARAVPPPVRVAPPTARRRWGITIAAACLATAAVAGMTLIGRKPATPARQPPVPLVMSADSSALTAAGATSCPEGMVLVRGGHAFMGATDLAHSQPMHEVTISTFCLDRTEVTVRAYLACVAAGSCAPPLDEVSWPGITPAEVKRYSPLCNVSYADRGDHPLNCVFWSTADGFCKKHGARLPTEAEWEFAARGGTSRKYVWGDDPPSAGHLNACGPECVAWWLTEQHEKREAMFAAADGFVGTAPVGSFPAGASAAGALDLAGNVWEWTADWYGPYRADDANDPRGPETGTARVARGGDFSSWMPDHVRPAYRWKTDPATVSHGLGFRCAASPR